MPIYEYRCTTCAAETEVIQKASDAPLTTCETCAGRLEKLISQSAFQFRGSGWYVTDYARKTAGGNKKSEGGDGKSGGGDTKSDTGDATRPDAGAVAKSDAATTPEASKEKRGESAETKKAAPAANAPTA